MGDYVNGIAHIKPNKKFKDAFYVLEKIYDLAEDLDIFPEDLFECLTKHGELLLPEKERKKIVRLTDDEFVKEYFNKHNVPDDELYDYSYFTYTRLTFGRICNIPCDFKMDATEEIQKEPHITFCLKYGDVEKTIYEAIDILETLADEILYFEIIGYSYSEEKYKRCIVKFNKLNEKEKIFSDLTEDELDDD